MAAHDFQEVADPGIVNYEGLPPEPVAYRYSNQQARNAQSQYDGDRDARKNPRASEEAARPGPGVSQGEANDCRRPNGGEREQQANDQPLTIIVRLVERGWRWQCLDVVPRKVPDHGDSSRNRRDHDHLIPQGDLRGDELSIVDSDQR
jgi:hypothetical protein